MDGNSTGDRESYRGIIENFDEGDWSEGYFLLILDYFVILLDFYLSIRVLLDIRSTLL